MRESFDIIICGGGAIGLCAALAIDNKVNHLQKLSILILDRSKKIQKINHDFDGRNIALNNASIRFAQNLGIWDSIKENAQPIKDIIVSDGTPSLGASSSYLHFSAAHIEQDSFGHFVLNPYLRQALLARITSCQNITIKYETEITDIHHQGEYTLVTDAKGHNYQTKLLIAADGKDSFVREYHGINLKVKDFGQSAIVLAVSHEKPHLGVAQEFFLPAGPFAILPLTKNRCSLVWVERHEVAKALMNAPQKLFAYELMRRFGDYLGDLKIISKKFSYPLSYQKAQQLSAPRTVLVGDAAHVIHPISGQGFNLGLRDVQAIADLVYEHHYAGLDIGSVNVLDTYQKQRQADIQILGCVTTSLNGFFSNNDAILQKIRRFGLAFINNIPQARDFFSKVASEGRISTE